MITVGCDRASSLEALDHRRRASPDVHATVGSAPARGPPRRRHDRRPVRRRPGCDPSRSASAASTTTTTTRRATCSARPSPRRSPSPTSAACRSSSTPARRGTTRSPSSTPRACPARTIFHCFTGGPDEARRVPRSRRVRQLLRHRHVPRRRRRARGGRARARSTARWSRPTARTSRRCPTAGKRNRPAWVPLVGACLADVHGVAVEEVARRHAAAPAALPSIWRISTGDRISPSRVVSPRPDAAAATVASRAEFLASSAPRSERPAPHQERTLRFDKADRRRLVLASALTVVALPAVWLVNRRRGRVDPAQRRRGRPAAPAGRRSTPSAERGRPDGRRSNRCTSSGRSEQPPTPPAPSTVAVGSSEDHAGRHGDGDLPPSGRRARGTCLFNGVRRRRAASRSSTSPTAARCSADTSARRARRAADELVLHPDAFVPIADLTERADPRRDPPVGERR